MNDGYRVIEQQRDKLKAEVERLRVDVRAFGRIHDSAEAEIEGLKRQLAEQDARGLRLAGENERLLAALTDIAWVQGFTTYDEARDCARRAILAYHDRLEEVIAEDISP